MDFQDYEGTEAVPFDEALDQAANELADSVTEGLSGAVREALGDPIVMALMTADRVDRPAFEAMLRRMGATLANAGPRPCLRC
ncbi:MAG: hypothetical protein ACREFQ_19920 [Stellaceae bacterium]